MATFVKVGSFLVSLDKITCIDTELDEDGRMTIYLGDDSPIVAGQADMDELLDCIFEKHMHDSRIPCFDPTSE